MIQYLPMIIVAAVLIGVYVTLRFRPRIKTRLRSRDIVRWAQAQGFNEQSATDPEFLRHFWVAAEINELFQPEFVRHEIHHHLEGEWSGRTWTGFVLKCLEQTRTQSSGGRFVRYSGVCLSSEVPLRGVELHPANRFVFTANILPPRDAIDVPYKDFQRAYQTRSHDRDFARRLLQRPLVDVLLAAPRFHLVLDPTRIIAYREGYFDVGDFQAALKLLAAILDHVAKTSAPG